MDSLRYNNLKNIIARYAPDLIDSDGIKDSEIKLAWMRTPVKYILVSETMLKSNKNILKEITEIGAEDKERIEKELFEQWYESYKSRKEAV